MQRVLITGCARSGTTLVNRLFHAFRGTTVIDHEIDLKDFLRLKLAGNVLVAKRTPKTIMSVPLPKDELLRQERLLIESNISVVNVIRDGRDVVHQHARGPRVNLNRWIGCILQSRIYRHLISIEIKYEDLVKDPNEVQNRIEDKIGLVQRAPFSEYPAFVSSSVFDEPEYRDFRQYDPRPIDAKSIGHSDTEYLALVTSEAERVLFEDLLARLGYLDRAFRRKWDIEQLSEYHRVFVSLSRELGFKCE